MTDLEMLREAARLMRERANAATPGPWSVELVGEGRAWVNLPGCPHGWGMHGFPAEAEHVASWHPAVALAVANSLERAATGLHDLVTGGHKPAADGWISTCVAVARAYLRREP
ncbi:MAG: hypothetical protein IRY85_10015 [Micromonosporaceae bacterium]|nr:hypothetical protein [Micromonosporaceae bacterium]